MSVTIEAPCSRELEDCAATESNVAALQVLTWGSVGCILKVRKQSIGLCMCCTTTCGERGEVNRRLACVCK